jgi:BlaI family transcriptional regulator, penicillinase repressor
MPRKTHNHRLDLPPLELDCMRALWGLGQATVHDVRARLLPERSLAYTTVMTVMDHLRGKGMVERARNGRCYLYRPLVTEEVVREHALDRLARNFFVNSRDKLMNYLVNEAGLRQAVQPPAERRSPVELPQSRREPERNTRIDTSLL